MRHLIHLLAAVTAAIAVAVTGPGWAPGAAAATGGAGATGRGDEIITSILAARRGTGRPSGTSAGTAPVCRTHVLTDRQVTYLIHVAATMPELLEASFLDAIERFANTTVTAVHPQPVATSASTTSTTSPPAPAPGPPGPVAPDPGDTTAPTTTPAPPPAAGPSTTAPAPTVDPVVTYWDLTVRICNGVADTMSVRPRVASGAVLGASALAGGRLRHTTRLPPPVVRMSPPPRLGPFGVAAATIVGEPVFFSVVPPEPVRELVPYGGRTVEVEATPDHIEVFGGEPVTSDVVVECVGFGVPYDLELDESPAEQASAPEACALVFEQRTGAPRRDRWHGYVALEWSGRYRVDGGAWIPLDGLFSTSVFAVSVGEVDTVISDEP